MQVHMLIIGKYAFNFKVLKSFGVHGRQQKNSIQMYEPASTLIRDRSNSRAELCCSIH